MKLIQMGNIQENFKLDFYAALSTACFKRKPKLNSIARATMGSIAIVDYKMGNLRSVEKTCKSLGVEVLITSDPDKIASATKLILPGVGHFGEAMKQLHQLNLYTALNEAVLERKVPIMGICLGMQLMAKSSEEGNSEGLGWFDAQVVRFKINDTLRYKVPNTGWNSVTIEKDHSIFNQIEAPEFYFVHAYHMVCNQNEDILCTTHYESDFTSAVSKNNILGFQFHPEKSHDAGKSLFRNFISI